MKQCPQCRTTYTDDTLRYCLSDGSELFEVDEDQETIAARRDEKVRVDIGRVDPAPTTITPPARPQTSPVLKIIAIAILIGLLVILGVAGIGTLIYFGAKGNSDPANTNKNIVANTSPTPDVEKQRLQDQLANMQRKLDEQQKNANRLPSPTPLPSSPGVVTARVNSPNDGFLALRDRPDADRGERLVKIPHGALVTIENCERNKVVIDSRSGRWCYISWGDYEGYVFDAWLIY